MTFWTGKKVLVGGGCGLVGSYLVPQLVEAGADVLVADNLSNGYIENISSVADKVRFAKVDLANMAVCNELTRQQDMVINLAATVRGMTYSYVHHGEMLVDNLLCTMGLLKAAQNNGVKRQVIVSSSCIYSDNAPIPTWELDTCIGQPERVNEGYGWAKRMQELAGSYYAKDYGVQVSILRLFNVYGGNYRYQSDKKDTVIPTLVKRVMNGEDPLVVWGSGNQRRNFIHGSDVAQLMMRVIEKEVDGPINIGFEDDTSISELVNIICEVSGKKPKIIFDNTKPSGMFRKCSDSKRLQNITDYVPKVSLRDGIKEMVDKWA